MSIKLSHAKYVSHGGYPVLLVVIEGEPTYLASENQKPTVLNAGLVFVGELFTDLGICPEVTITPRDGGPTTLRGFSNDPRLLALYRRFLDAINDGTFQDGPVPIPG